MLKIPGGRIVLLTIVGLRVRLQAVAGMMGDKPHGTSTVYYFS